MHKSLSLMSWLSIVMVLTTIVFAFMGQPPSLAQVDNSCLNSTILRPGIQVRKRSGVPSNLRLEPSTRGQFMGQIASGIILDLIDGPVCAEGYIWWYVRTSDTHQEGWTPEGFMSDPWLEPVDPWALTPSPTLIPTLPPAVIPMEAYNSTTGIVLSDDEEVIVFADKYLSEDSQVYVASVDGSNIRKVMEGSSGRPVWSPDGRKLLVSSERGLTVLDVTTGSTDVVMNTLNYRSYNEYSWSPDGSQIVFTADRGLDSPDIFLVDTDGSDLRNLTNHPATDIHPTWGTWNQLGDSILFTSDRSGNQDIYTVNVDGAEITQFTDTPQAEFGVATSEDQYISWLTDSHITIVDKWMGMITIPPGNYIDSGLTFSPNGNQIAFFSQYADEDTLGLYFMHCNALDRTLVAENVLRDALSWSPKGTKIVYQSGNMDDLGAIYTIDLDTGEKTFLANPYVAALLAWRPKVQ